MCSTYANFILSVQFFWLFLANANLVIFSRPKSRIRQELSVLVMKFYYLFDSFVFIKTCSVLLIKYELKVGFFSESAIRFSNLQEKRIFQKTILNLKLKI